MDDLHQQCSDTMDAMSSSPIDIASSSGFQLNSTSTSASSPHIRRDLSPNTASTRLKPVPSSSSLVALDHLHLSPMSHVSHDAYGSMSDFDHDDELDQFGPFILLGDDEDLSAEEAIVQLTRSGVMEVSMDRSSSAHFGTEQPNAPITLARAKKPMRRPRGIPSSRTTDRLDVPETRAYIVAGSSVTPLATTAPHAPQEDVFTHQHFARTDLVAEQVDFDLGEACHQPLAHHFKPRPRVGSSTRPDMNVIVPSPNDLAEERQAEASKNDVELWLMCNEVEILEKSGNMPVAAQHGRRGATQSNIATDIDRSYQNGGLMHESVPTVASPLYTTEKRSEYQNPSDENEQDEAHNWDESGVEAPSAETVNMQSSTYAMAAFERVARQWDSVSITATLGSFKHRRSLDSLRKGIVAIDGNVTLQTPGQTKEHRREEGEPHISLLERLLRSSTSANIVKNKPVLFHHHTDISQASRKRAGSEAPSTHQNAEQSSNSPTSPTLSSSFRASFSNALRRPLSSRGDSSKTQGLVHLWTNQGGPPVANPRPPSLDPATPSPASHATYANVKSPWESELDVEDEQVSGEHYPYPSVFLLVIPGASSLEAFRDHAQQSFPYIPLYLLERVAKQQSKRYSRLMGNRRNHASSGNREAGFLDDRRATIVSRGKKMAQMKQYRISRGRVPDRDDTDPAQTAEFPPGIPPPPVPRLPAVFECPWCYKLLENIVKPSDWTKHVLEDVEAFTCTFPMCPTADTTLFKRKADWIRHEYESHRHLEWWACDEPGCHHVCYREENFTQHLSRLHGQRGENRTRSRSTLNMPNPSTISPQVAKCHHQSSRKPEDEPCVFCGSRFNDWKKLMAHLAMHMERVSLSVMALIESRDPMEAHRPGDDKPQPVDKQAGELSGNRRATSHDSNGTGGIMSRSITKNNNDSPDECAHGTTGIMPLSNPSKAQSEYEGISLHSHMDHSPAAYARPFNGIRSVPPSIRLSPNTSFTPDPDLPIFVSNSDWTPSIENDLFAKLKHQVPLCATQTAPDIYSSSQGVNADAFVQSQTWPWQPYAIEDAYTTQPPPPGVPPTNPSLSANFPGATSQMMAPSQSWHPANVPRSLTGTVEHELVLGPPQAPDSSAWWQWFSSHDETCNMQPGNEQVYLHQPQLEHDWTQAMQMQASYPPRGPSPAARGRRPNRQLCGGQYRI